MMHAKSRKLPTAAELSALGGIKATSIMVRDSRREKGSAWRASCEWNGRAFEAVSRNGATNALCRELVAAGIPDQVMQVLGSSGELRFTHRSIHRAAGWTYAEGAKATLRMLPYEKHPLSRCGVEPPAAFELRGVVWEGSEPTAEIRETAA